MEQNWLVNSLQESELAIAYQRTQVDDSKKMNVESKSDLDIKICRCKDLASKLEAKDKECQRQNDEVKNLKKDLEKYQDELKVRIRYGGSTEALDKMLSHQKTLQGY